MPGVMPSCVTWAAKGDKVFPRVIRLIHVNVMDVVIERMSTAINTDPIPAVIVPRPLVESGLTCASPPAGLSVS